MFFQRSIYVSILFFFAAADDTESTAGICEDTPHFGREDCPKWKNLCDSAEEATVQDFLRTHCSKTCNFCSQAPQWLEPGLNQSWMRRWWDNIEGALNEYRALATNFISSNPLFSTVLDGDVSQLGNLPAHGESNEEGLRHLSDLYPALNMYVERKASDMRGRHFMNVRLVIRGKLTEPGLEAGLMLQEHEGRLLELSKGEGVFLTFDKNTRLPTLKKCDYAKDETDRMSIPNFQYVKVCGRKTWLMEVLPTPLGEKGVGMPEFHFVKTWTSASENAREGADLNTEVFSAAYTALFGSHPESVNLARQSSIAQELRSLDLRGIVLDSHRGRVMVVNREDPVAADSQQVQGGLLEGLATSAWPSGARGLLSSCRSGDKDNTCSLEMLPAADIGSCLLAKKDQPECQEVLARLYLSAEAPVLTLPAMCPELKQGKRVLHIYIEDLPVQVEKGVAALGEVSFVGEVMLVDERGNSWPSRDTCTRAWQVRLKRYLQAPLPELQKLRRLVRNVVVGRAAAQRLEESELKEYMMASALETLSRQKGAYKAAVELPESSVAFDFSAWPETLASGLAKDLKLRLDNLYWTPIDIGPISGDAEDDQNLEFSTDDQLAQVLVEETPTLCSNHTCLNNSKKMAPSHQCLPNNCEVICCEAPPAPPPPPPPPPLVQEEVEEDVSQNASGENTPGSEGSDGENCSANASENSTSQIVENDTNQSQQPGADKDGAKDAPAPPPAPVTYVFEFEGKGKIFFTTSSPFAQAPMQEHSYAGQDASFGRYVRVPENLRGGVHIYPPSVLQSQAVVQLSATWNASLCIFEAGGQFAWPPELNCEQGIGPWWQPPEMSQETQTAIQGSMCCGTLSTENRPWILNGRVGVVLLKTAEDVPETTTDYPFADNKKVRLRGQAQPFLSDRMKEDVLGWSDGEFSAHYVDVPRSLHEAILLRSSPQQRLNGLKLQLAASWPEAIACVVEISGQSAVVWSAPSVRLPGPAWRGEATHEEPRPTTMHCGRIFGNASQPLMLTLKADHPVSILVLMPGKDPQAMAAEDERKKEEERAEEERIRLKEQKDKEEEEARQRKAQEEERAREEAERKANEPTITDELAARSLQVTFGIHCPTMKSRGRMVVDTEDRNAIINNYTVMLEAVLKTGARPNEEDFFQCLWQHVPLDICVKLLHTGLDGHSMMCSALCSLEAERREGEAENEDIYLDSIKKLLKKFKPSLVSGLCFGKYSMYALALALNNMVAMSELLKVTRKQPIDANLRMAFNTTLIHWIAYYKRNNFGLRDFWHQDRLPLDLLDSQDSFGRSALMVALSVGNTGMADELVEEDAETFSKNRFGETAEMLMSDERLRRRYKDAGAEERDYQRGRTLDKGARCDKIFERAGCPQPGRLAKASLRKCYHKMTMASHPDKCSPEARQRCERKTVEVNECYQRYGGRGRSR